MPSPVLAAALLVWLGATVILSRVPWFGRRTLVTRLRPYEAGAVSVMSGGGELSAVTSIRELVGPVARAVGERIARLLGVHEPLALRLQRIHAQVDVTAFRVRQLAWTAGGLAAGTLLATAVRPPLSLAMLFVGGGALLAFLIVEQQLAVASDRWKRRIFLELSVLSEQLGMLLGAGFSLGAALNRLARRGSGACATDLALVCGRVRQGLTEVEALREWAAIADVDALTRLVSVLALNREAGDLGRLASEEARNIRRDVQREFIEQIERRGQQVWIPVTVATLVPGALLLAVPFIEAMRLFSTT
ncbi:MAG: type II secretion system F family protein [Microthrixaceae bacterium]